MRLEHHLVGGYVRYVSPYIIIISIILILTLLLPVQFSSEVTEQRQLACLSMVDKPCIHKQYHVQFRCIHHTVP